MAADKIEAVGQADEEEGVANYEAEGDGGGPSDEKEMSCTRSKSDDGHGDTDVDDAGVQAGYFYGFLSAGLRRFPEHLENFQEGETERFYHEGMVSARHKMNGKVSDKLMASIGRHILYHLMDKVAAKHHDLGQVLANGWETLQQLFLEKVVVAVELAMEDLADLGRVEAV